MHLTFCKIMYSPLALPITHTTIIQPLLSISTPWTVKQLESSPFPRRCPQFPLGIHWNPLEKSGSRYGTCGRRSQPAGGARDPPPPGGKLRFAAGIPRTGCGIPPPPEKGRKQALGERASGRRAVLGRPPGSEMWIGIGVSVTEFGFVKVSKPKSIICPIKQP